MNERTETLAWLWENPTRREEANAKACGDCPTRLSCKAHTPWAFGEPHECASDRLDVVVGEMKEAAE